MVSIKRINVKRQQKLSCKNQTIKDKMNLKEIEQTINATANLKQKTVYEDIYFQIRRRVCALKDPSCALIL
jgi:hypothetical protein